MTYWIARSAFVNAGAGSRLGFDHMLDALRRSEDPAT